MPALLDPDLTSRATAPARWTWTPDRAAVFHERYADGWSDGRISEELGCHQTTVLLFRRACGLEPHYRAGRSLAGPRPGWGLCGGVAASQHHRALEAAGWAWPLFDSRGDAVDLPPLAVRLLLVLLRDGPRTRRELVAAVGIAWNPDGNQLHVGHPSRDALLVMAGRGLVERGGGRPAPFSITDAGLGLLMEAAGNTPEADGVTLRPADVLAMCGVETPADWQ